MYPEIKIFIRDRLPLLIFVVFIFIIGIIFGTIAVSAVDYSLRQDIFHYFNDFMYRFDSLEYSSANFFIESIKFNLFNIFMIWIFSISVILMPLIPVLIFIKGFVLGFTVGFLIKEYSFKGIVIAMSAVFPQNIIIIPAYILAGVMGIFFSIRLIKYYRRLERLDAHNFMTYSLRMFMLAFLISIASFLETYISPLLFQFAISWWF